MKIIAVLSFFVLSFLQLDAQNTQIVLSHYVFPEFADGFVSIGGGRTQQMRLNYNTVTEEMVFQRGGQVLAIGEAEMNELEYVAISGRKFVVKNGKFVEIIYEAQDRTIYAEHRSTVVPPGNPAPYGGTSHVSAVDRYSGITGDGNMYYKLQLPDGYKVKPVISYLAERDGKITRIFNIRQFRKVYSDKKDAFDKYIKENKVTFESLSDITDMAHAMNTLQD
jgi:hypothetical protein